MNAPFEPVPIEAQLAWSHTAPRLDDDQIGSLNHIFQLSDQLQDDWSGMLGPSTLQEDFGGLRFQLAYMAYALALTHVHRLPAAPVVFKRHFDRLIGKILSPDTWLYWHFVSTGGGPLNQSLGDLPAEWNPVGRDNIMYSAYVQSMALLYHYLFRDPKYAAEGALTFSINPLFWGAGGKHFAYDERSLNDHLYWMMVERGYLGIACEPNCVFQICNQPAILGFRFHDLIYGGDVAGEVTKGYLKAWNDFGIVTPEGSYTMLVMERERVPISPPDLPSMDFWLASLMHAWNPEFVETHYPAQKQRWSINGPDGTLVVRPGASLAPDNRPMPQARDLGWAAVCASEVGDTERLADLLGYADRFLNPIRENGALRYPRQDELVNAAGWPIAMDPHTSNALLPYARLNVPHGLRKLYDGPLDDRHFEQPTLVEMTDGIDVRRAWYDDTHRALALTLGSTRGAARPVRLEIGNIGPLQHRHVYRDGQPYEHARVEDDRLVIDLDHNAAVDLLIS